MPTNASAGAMVVWNTLWPKPGSELCLRMYAMMAMHTMSSMLMMPTMAMDEQMAPTCE